MPEVTAILAEVKPGAVCRMHVGCGCYREIEVVQQCPQEGLTDCRMRGPIERVSFSALRLVLARDVDLCLSAIVL